MRENLALSAQGQLRIREHEQIGSEFIEAQVKAFCGTAINVIKMIMFISMHLLSITQLVTVQQLLMFRFWAAGQIPRSTSDLSNQVPALTTALWGWAGGALRAIFSGVADCRETLFLQNLLWNMLIPEMKQTKETNKENKNCISV